MVVPGVGAVSYEQGDLGSSAARGLTDYSQVDMLAVRYKSVNFRAGTNPDAPDRWAQID